MRIFDGNERTNIEPACHLISQFDYLNRSARPEAAHVRTIMEEMLALYPEPHRSKLVPRLQSRDDIQHNGAVFELILHELLIRRKCRVIAIEPEIPGNSHKPDFLVESPEGFRFYLEAKIATGALGAAPGADRRMRDALQAIDEVDSPNFFLCLRSHGIPASQVPKKQLRHEVQSFVNALDNKTVVAAFEAGRSSPTYTFEHDGLRVQVEVVPKRFKGNGGRAIGVQVMPGGVVEPHLPIRNALNEKAGRYGKPNLPFIIAVNALDQYANEDSAIEALFGTKCFAERDDGSVRIAHEHDGVWGTAAHPIYQRVSAVFSTERLSAWKLGQCSARLIVNPWAAHTIPDYPLGVDVLQGGDECLARSSGLTLREILGLPEGWPE